ncbi:MAG: glycosyltransferase family 4 protein [Gemmatimonadetes bacterium]|nr:glycosyltransferase family 4 protein [Gemmatimonadota bacterium]
MRIVLISYHYPPARAVGGLRAAKDAEALRAAGHEIHVIAAQVPEAHSPRTTTPSGIVVERVHCWPSPRQLWVRWRTRGARAQTHQTVSSTPGPARPPREPPTWKRWIFSLLWLPDDLQGFIIPAARAARRAFPGGPDLVVTSAPPFSVHLAAMLVATQGVRWIAEFRDPWTDNPGKPAAQRSALSERIERWLEARTLNCAERVVAASDGISRVLRPKLPTERQDRVLVVRNGIDWLAPPAPPVAAGPRPRRIVHAGVFYLGRDPRLFLRALAEVVRQDRLGPADLVVELVGQCRSFGEVSVEAEVRALGLDSVVRFTDWLPHERTQDLLRTADALLLLAQGQPDQVPNKLYEYLGTRRPILAFVDAGGETARMLQEAGGHAVVASSDLTDAVDAVRAVLGRKAGWVSVPDPLVLGRWTTPVQMRRLVEAVGV